MYGEENWRQQATEALKQMDCFNEQTTKEFNETLAWLHEHAVSGQVVLYGMDACCVVLNPIFKFRFLIYDEFHLLRV